MTVQRTQRPPTATGRSIRWWPALGILGIQIGFLLWIWLRDSGSTQHKVIPTLAVLLFGTLGLFLWAVLFSRLPRRARLRLLLSVTAAVAMGAFLLEVKGVDGNLVPIVGWRWSGERTFDSRAASGTSVTQGRLHDYSQFYGADRLATIRDTKLAPDWQASPPREIWRREVGEGWSSFAVVGSAAVTQELRGEDEVVVRYQLDNGAQVWQHSDHAPFVTTVGGSGPRATPTIVDGRVYALGATGNLNCLDLETGEPIWYRNVLRDHEAYRPDWGMPSSPLVVEDLVIVQLGKRGIGLAAYDRRSGEPVWRMGEDGGTYSSPILTSFFDRELVLSVNQSSVTGHDPGTGAIVFSAPWPNPGGGERITMPLKVADDLMLVSAGYGVGSRLFRIVPGSDSWRVESLWESSRLKSKFAPMVFHEGVVYGLDDGVLVALNPVDGERLWKSGRYGHGQMILVGDLLLIQEERGDVVLVEADPAQHRELGRFAALSGKTWNPPALSGNLLLVRNNREAACYELPVLEE